MYVCNGMQVCTIVHCVFVLIYVLVCNLYVLSIPKVLFFQQLLITGMYYVGIGVDQNNLLWVINHRGIFACS